MTNKQTNYFIQVEPSQKIALCVMEKIEKYESKHCKVRMFLHGSLIIGSSLALIPTLSYLSSSLSQSGFNSYLSLILSDGAYVYSHLGELVLSIATSWPLPASILILGIAIIFTNSLRRIFQYSEELSHNYNPQLS